MTDKQIGTLEILLGQLREMENTFQIAHPFTDAWKQYSEQADALEAALKELKKKGKR